MTIKIREQNTVVPVVEWVGESSETADNVLQVSSDPEARSARTISNWLRDFLKAGAKPANEIFKDAEAKFGECSRRVQRASSLLRVVKQQKNRQWFWSLPEADPREAAFSGASLLVQ